MVTPAPSRSTSRARFRCLTPRAGAPSMRRARRGATVLVSAVVVASAASFAGAAGAVAVVGHRAKRSPATAVTRVTLPLGTIAVQAATFPAPALPDTLTAKLQASLSAYVSVSTVKPLRSGRTPTSGDLATAFDLGALATAGGPDGAVVLDLGLGRAKGKLVVRSPPIPVTVLFDQTGQPVLATATLDLLVKGTTRKGTFRVQRLGDLVLAPNPDGNWLVTAWELEVTRAGKGLPTYATTPTTSTTTTTVPGASTTGASR